MYFGGEPVRASLYKSGQMSYKNIYATIALDKYIELAGKIPCILVGFALGPLSLAGFLAGTILSGQLIAVFMSNAGGSPDPGMKAGFGSKWAN